MVFDPGPLVGQIAGQWLRSVVARADLVSVSAAELVALEAAPAPRRLVVRRGAAGAELRAADPVEAVDFVASPGVVPPGPVIDTNGAGDTHLGALLAARAAGLDWAAALGLANRAAAFSITRRGAASGPTRRELGLSG
ncbi:MAG: hypothetical protein IPG94_12515 [Kineosporiaceae bacterium]|nr:hypothetical protein [Kineosporiaceae bacterium]